MILYFTLICNTITRYFSTKSNITIFIINLFKKNSLEQASLRINSTLNHILYYLRDRSFLTIISNCSKQKDLISKKKKEESKN